MSFHQVSFLKLGPASRKEANLRSSRDLVVDNVLNVGNVEASGSDVGGDEHAARVAGKSLQILQPRSLMHLCVEAKGLAFQQPEQVDEPENEEITNVKLYK